MGTIERISPNPKHPQKIKKLSRDTKHIFTKYCLKKKNFFPNSQLEPDMQYALLSTLLVSLADCRNILSSEASISKEVARYDLEVDADYPTELVEQAVIKAQSVVQNFLREQEQELEGGRREKRSVEGPRWEEFSERLCNVVNLPDFVQRVEVRQCEHADGHNVGEGIG